MKANDIEPRSVDEVRIRAIKIPIILDFFAITEFGIGSFNPQPRQHWQTRRTPQLRIPDFRNG